MAKGDILSKLQMGLQPGLVPPAAENNFGGSVGGPSNPAEFFKILEESQKGGLRKLPYMTGSSDPNAQIIEANNPAASPNTASPRIMPMQSGGMFAQGKHPIGTTPKKMLKYNAQQ